MDLLPAKADCPLLADTVAKVFLHWVSQVTRCLTFLFESRAYGSEKFRSAGDFLNEPDAIAISDRGLFHLLAGKLARAMWGLLQHNRHL
jgi:hypothetical protein